MILQGRVPPRTLYKGFYLEPLKVPAEQWAGVPLKILLKICFPERADGFYRRVENNALNQHQTFYTLL